MDEEYKSYKEEYWKKKLKPEVYNILRKKHTEPAFTGKFLRNKRDGIYICAGCKNPLFSSKNKFDSGSGWPSFWEIISKANIELRPDYTLGMKRIEVLCSRCGGHLGHVFDDGPKPTGKRYCINSLSLDFKEEK